MGYFGSSGKIQKLFLGTHVFEQLLFSMFLSILILDFDLILGTSANFRVNVGSKHCFGVFFFYFLQPLLAIFRIGLVLNNILGSVQIVEQLLSSLFRSIYVLILT